MNNVIIFRDVYNTPSETFIRNQVKYYNKYVVHICCTKDLNKTAFKSKNLFCLENISHGKIKTIIFKIFRRSSAIESYIKSINPRLIHAHFGIDATLIMPIAKKLGIPLYITFHGLDVNITNFHAFKSYMTHKLYPFRRKATFQYAKKLIFVSDFLKNKFIKKFDYSQKCVTSYIGVEIPDRIDVVNKEFDIIFVGRLIENKGLQVLIESIPLISKKVKTVVVGDGPLREAMENKAAELHLDVTFTGWASEEEVKQYMLKSKILVLPTLRAKDGAEEALGMVFLEAQALGLPVICSDCGGSKEVVEHGKSGFVVPNNNISETAKHIEELLFSGTIKKYSREALNNARNFDISILTSKLEAIYHD